jgi:hypothetical protein
LSRQPFLSAPWYTGSPKKDNASGWGTLLFWLPKAEKDGLLAFDGHSTGNRAGVSVPQMIMAANRLYNGHI